MTRVGSTKLPGRGPLNALIAQSMRRDGIKEITFWADHHGIGRSTLYSLLRGRETETGVVMMPSIDTLVKLASALTVPTHKLLYLLAPQAPGAQGEMVDAPNALQPSLVTKIPVQVAGWCGAGPAQDEVLEEEPVFVEARFAKGKRLRAFRIRGDSMAAGKRPIYSGDLVIVDTNNPGANTDAVVARLSSDAYVCKTLKDDRFGKLLQSRNVDHTNGTPSVIPLSDVAEVIGKVVRIISEVDHE